MQDQVMSHRRLLVLPQGMGERGLRYEVEGWDGQYYHEERWYFGEVD